MGQEIVYCSRCQKQLRSRDFEKGAAFRFDALACCLDCAPELMKDLPPAALQEFLRKTHAPPKASPPLESARRPPMLSASSASVGVVTTSSRPGRPAGLLAAGAAALGLALALVLFAARSGSKPAPLPDVAPAATAPRDALVPAATPPPVRPSPDPAVSPNTDLLRQARDFVRTNPTDFAGQIELYERALGAIKTSPGIEEATREREAVRTAARQRIALELERLDSQVRDLAAQESFDPALERIEAARGLLSAAEWTDAIQTRIDEVRRRASELFATIQASAIDAQRRGAKEDVRSARDRVARWGIQKFALELDKALSLAGRDPIAPPPSPESAAFARCRDAAFAHALARDYDAAAAELKRGAGVLRDAALIQGAAEDGEALRQAAQALKDALQVPSSWAKGQRISFETVNAAGGVERVDGTLLRMDPYRVEIDRSGADPLVVPLGQIRVGSLVSFLKQPQNIRPLAVLCLLEGEPDTARSLAQGAALDLPERYWAWAKDVGGPEPAREQAARALLYEAERGAQDPALAAECALKYAALLREYSDARVVRRNRAAILSRSQGGKDYVFFPEDMAAGGTFAWTKNPKTETCFSSDSDTEPTRIKDNFVEITFSALPETEYRCWVYVGACCAETFAFFYQATALVGSPSKEAKDSVACEPGSGTFLPAKIPVGGLKKTHAQHNGPKSPARWEWVAIPLAKFTAAGPKRLRLLTNQKGFSVAFVSISATKQDHPRESESKAWETSRNQTPGAKTLNRLAPPPKDRPGAADGVVVFSLDLEGGKKPVSIQTGSVVKAPDRPGEHWCLFAEPQPTGISPLFVDVGGPNSYRFEGEEVFSFDYWVDSGVVQIVFNFGDRTRGLQHDGSVPQPVTGKWTHASFRLADLGDAATRLRPGDLVAGFYMQALGGTTRKFFVDNLEMTKPRVRK
jgi:hypothetical protein